MILSFFTQKSTRSAKLSSVFTERFSGEGQADFAINKAHKMSLKGRNNLYISCVFNGFKYTLISTLYIMSQHYSINTNKSDLTETERIDHLNQLFYIPNISIFRY